MKLTYKEYSLIFVITVLLFIVVFWRVQKYRMESLVAERTLSRSLQAHEMIDREYIPLQLQERRSDELTKMGANLWGE
jgi:hypothetical protein